MGFRCSYGRSQDVYIYDSTLSPAERQHVHRSGGAGAWRSTCVGHARHLRCHQLHRPHRARRREQGIHSYYWSVLVQTNPTDIINRKYLSVCLLPFLNRWLDFDELWQHLYDRTQKKYIGYFLLRKCKGKRLNTAWVTRDEEESLWQINFHASAAAKACGSWTAWTKIVNLKKWPLITPGQWSRNKLMQTPLWSSILSSQFIYLNRENKCIFFLKLLI